MWRNNNKRRKRKIMRRVIVMMIVGMTEVTIIGVAVLKAEKRIRKR
jgi:hypothetical protein